MAYYNRFSTFAEALDIVARGIPPKDITNFAHIIITNKLNMTIEEIKKILILLISKYDFDITYDNNMAIQGCCFDDDPEIISLLIELGADIHANNDSLFNNACSTRNIILVKFLLQYVDLSKNNRVLRVCVSNDDIELVNILLEAGIDPNYKRTKALLISSHRNYEITKLLLEYGANVNARNGAALVNATLHGKHDIVELLISYGANLGCFAERKSTNGMKDFEKTCNLLMSEGIDPMSLMMIFARYSSNSTTTE